MLSRIILVALVVCFAWPEWVHGQENPLARYGVVDD